MIEDSELASLESSTHLASIWEDARDSFARLLSIVMHCHILLEVGSQGEDMKDQIVTSFWKIWHFEATLA